MLACVGAFSYLAVGQSAKNNVESKLTTILETEIKALTIWTKEQQRSVSYFANRDDLRNAASELLESPLGNTDSDGEVANAARAKIETLCRQAMQSFGYVEFCLLDLRGNVVVPFETGPPQEASTKQWTSYLAILAAGKSVFAPPSLDYFSRPSSSNAAVTERRPLLMVAAPVRDSKERVIAAVGFGIPPEDEFTRILSVARAGESGETYAFNSDGLLISDSRFDLQLSAAGRLPIGDSGLPSSPVLTFRLEPPKQNKLTAAVTSALAARAAGENTIGIYFSGYEDYRGIWSVAAYQWLPQYDFGVVTRIDYKEAYAPGLMLRNLLASLFGIGLLAAAVNIYNTWRLGRIQRRVTEAEQTVQRLGQYTLQEKIGEGGMGEVYRASHAMLRRPTAVKLLRPERSSEAAVTRFEREVQMTALLTHPNTIAIYDYGRTPEGTFYYAMEYLDGVDLRQIVKLDGPQPAGRVIGALRQVCNSLTEAHEAGLVHRDIKPANVILFRRGKRPDIVKLLDFGLVHNEHQTVLAPDCRLAGTPAFMSPESFRAPDQVDARSDLYAVGALGYYLLTGEYVFQGPSVGEIASQHATQIPKTPTERLGRPVDQELSALIMQCLSKSPSDRPPSAAYLSKALAACEVYKGWTREQANAWWDAFDLQNASGNAINEVASETEFTMDPAATITHYRLK